jgi:hypothetical protein
MAAYRTSDYIWIANLRYCRSCFVTSVLMELDEQSGRTTGRRTRRIHLAGYSLRHRRDGSAGTTILFYLRIYHRPHWSSVMTAGRREPVLELQWSMARGPHRRRIRRGRKTFRGTTGQTEQRAD